MKTGTKDRKLVNVLDLDGDGTAEVIAEGFEIENNPHTHLATANSQSLSKLRGSRLDSCSFYDLLITTTIVLDPRR